MIHFFEPCIPPKTTSQTKRVVHGTGVFFKSAKQKESEATYDAILINHRPKKALSGPLTINIVFTWPWRANEPKKVKELGNVPHTTRPDLDNLVKGLIDRMAALQLIENDAIVYSLSASKFYGDRPGIEVTINDPFDDGK